ncbi:VWA domain-containing protein [Candidatus Korobacter versatilis]|nr:VWA domain-containing protein [Candidatus Koribacter versatilis]
MTASGVSLAQNELDLYTTAVRQSRISDRSAWMARFLKEHPQSDLREDALEVLVWDAMESGQRDQSRQYAQELRQIDPHNALAMAVVAETRAETTGRADKKAAAQAFEIAKAGIQVYPQMHRPEGMREGEFILLQRQVVAVLDGEAGLGYLADKDYEAARRYLHEAVAIRPQDPRYLYGLSLALLDGKDAMQQEGYLYLARTVNLTQGTPAGQQIANYAQKRFEKQGGTTASWNEYLAAATTPGMPRRAPATQPEAPIVAKNVPPTRPGVQPQSEPRETNPEEIPQPTFKREYVARTSPVSMGILIQTEHLTKENRRQILDALTDMIRHLRNDDEVFIMAYGKSLQFEQDLTGNPKLLEEAMEQIKAESGTALLDAVGFAAGHLERIATNKNRLLLVISDGRNTPSKDNPLTLSQKLNTVRVDCIGLDVDGDSGRRQLESLAAYSGGQVSFASDTRQLRTAAVQMAEAIGIEFPD